MYLNDRNIYKSARMTAGKTQERAAELLGVSVESLRAYETGVRLPPNAVVAQMVIFYDSQALAFQHIRAGGDIARESIPDIQEIDRSAATLKLVHLFYEFADNHRDRELLKIAADGRTDEDEQPLYDAISAELDEFMKAILELRCSRQSAP